MYDKNHRHFVFSIPKILRKYFLFDRKLLKVVRTQYATGMTEAAQHSQNLEAWFANAPGLKVVMPSTAYDAKGLLKSATRDNNPVLFIENRVLYYKKFKVSERD